MKKIILLLAIVAGLASCKKDQTEVNSGLFGTWELRGISGGWGIAQVYTPGNGNKYEFTIDSSYVRYKNNAIENQGKFSLNIIGKERGFDYGSIKFTQPAYSDAFQIKKDTMYIGTNIADGPSFLYVKIK